MAAALNCILLLATILMKSFTVSPESTDVSLKSAETTTLSSNLPEKMGINAAVAESPAARVHLVKNSNFAAWRKSQGPNTVLFHRGGSSVLFLLHRNRRQAPADGGDGGDSGDGSGAKAHPKIVTPVLPINGERGFNDTDCLAWEDVAVLMRSSIHPKHKRAYIDPRSCNINEGLECLPFDEKGAIVYRCQCMLVYGPKAVYTNYSVDDRGRFAKSCFIPAGLGWSSECHAKSWSHYGYPLPFGDPQGTNAEQAAQKDAINKPDGEQVIIEYIRWNSIVPRCVPHAECREKGTYSGQRCQCLKGHKLEKPEGKCSGASSIRPLITTATILVLIMTFPRYL